MLFTNERLSCFAKDPAVVKFGGSYFMYYSVRYPDKRIGIGIARSSDMEEWEDIGEIPILYDYEKNGIAAPGAIVLEGKSISSTREVMIWEKPGTCPKWKLDLMKTTPRSSARIFDLKC